MRLSLVCIIVGLIGTLGLMRMMSTLLFGVTPTDPFTFFLGVGSAALGAGFAAAQSDICEVAESMFAKIR